MKKILLFNAILLFLTTNTYANVPFKKVQNCQSDYFNGSFCAKKNITLYKNALKTQKANFNQKYILLNTGNSDSLELIALDTKTGIAHPLNYQFTGWKNNQGKTLKKPSFKFSLDHPKVCVFGSQYDGEHPGTHENYSNIRQCFMIETDHNSTLFGVIHSDQIQYEYNDKTKQWKPIQ